MNETHNERALSGQDAFEARLREALNAVQAPTSLQTRLLQIPDLDAGGMATTAQPMGVEAANAPQFLRRLLPAAAALLIAIGIGLYYEPSLNAALASEIFGHIYLEEPDYGNDAVLPLAEVNAHLQPVTGDALQTDGAELLEVTFAKDCYIAKQRTMHIVLKGETGPVNVMMIPERVVDNEVKIADRRFSGLVTPASGGTLVVVGNKQEPITEHRDRIAAQLRWEY
ncbi:MAG: DUF3379 family protein [Pseudohongiellaceae bacterium]